MNKDVTLQLANLSQFKEEMHLLRSIVSSCGLKETYKWKQAVYTLNGKNVVAIASFKNYCAVSFFKGTLLTDPKNILEQQGENALYFRILKFTTIKEITNLKPVIKSYILEAITIEAAGKIVAKKVTTTADYPKELIAVFKVDLAFERAFEALTLGRQRAYIIHISSAKQEATKISRIDNNRKRIMAGYGMNDCICGLTKRKPGCDGSHKHIVNYKLE